MALTLQEAADALGMSYDATQRRVAMLRAPLGDSVRSGKRGVLMLEHGALEALRRLEGLCDDGHSLREASRIVTRELRESDDVNSDRSPHDEMQSSAYVEALRARLEAVERERDTLARELERVWALVEQAPPRLPATRTSWWARLLGR